MKSGTSTESPKVGFAVLRLYNPSFMSIRKAKKPAITSEWRENKIAQEKAQQEAGLMARQFAREKVMTTVARGARSAMTFVGAAAGALMAVLLAISLFTYTPTDPGFSVTGASGVENACGITGAWTADILYWLFGYSAWWIVFAFFSLFVSSILVITARRESSTWFRAGGSFLCFLLVMASSVCIEALQLGYLGGHLPSGAGGLFGYEVASCVAPYLGVWGSTVLGLFLLALGSSLAFGFSWGTLFDVLGICCEAVVKVALRCVSKSKPQEKPHSPLDGMTVQDSPVTVKSVATPSLPSTPRMPVKTIRERPPRASAPKEQRELFGQDGRVVASFELLQRPPEHRDGVNKDAIGITSRLIESKLKTYHVDARVVDARVGPVITQYWLELSEGVKGSQVEKIRKDLARALSADNSIRIVPVISGTPYMGLEIPNNSQQRLTVYLSEIIGSAEFENSRSLLTLALGKDIGGNSVVADLARLPHLLIGGTTGSGKSVAVNSMILSLLFKCDPSQLRLVLIDPKLVEFSLYQGIPHLLCPVVTDMNKAANALNWLVQEMDHRYALMSHLGVRSFDAYNEKVRAAIAAGTPLADPFDVTPENPEPHKVLAPFPYIVCFIDEFADLILVQRRQVETLIMRLAQKARAAGIHMVLATQRPSVDIVTPLIKTNIVARICFQVSSRFDSQVVLDEPGAQDLLGHGDMLMKVPGSNSPLRVQSCMVTDREVENIANQLKSMAAPEYVEGVTDSAESSEGAEGFTLSGGHTGREADPLYDRAVQIVLESKRATTSFVQRRLQIGYNRAANLLEAMEEAGIISKPNPAGKREILVRDGELFQ